MAVKVRLNPVLQRFVTDYNHETGILLEKHDGRTVYEIIEKVNVPPKEVLAVMINSYPAKFSSIVNDGDTVTLCKFLAGG